MSRSSARPYTLMKQSEATDSKSSQIGDFIYSLSQTIRAMMSFNGFCVTLTNYSPMCICFVGQNRSDILSRSLYLVGSIVA